MTIAGVFAPVDDAKAVWAMLTSSWMNLLLVCIPLGIVSGIMKMNPTLVFVSVRAALAGVGFGVVGARCVLH